MRGEANVPRHRQVTRAMRLLRRCFHPIPNFIHRREIDLAEFATLLLQLALQRVKAGDESLRRSRQYGFGVELVLRTRLTTAKSRSPSSSGRAIQGVRGSIDTNLLRSSALCRPFHAGQFFRQLFRVKVTGVSAPTFVLFFLLFNCGPIRTS